MILRMWLLPVLVPLHPKAEVYVSPTVACQWQRYPLHYVFLWHAFPEAPARGTSFSPDKESGNSALRPNICRMLLVACDHTAKWRPAVAPQGHLADARIPPARHRRAWRRPVRSRTGSAQTL